MANFNIDYLIVAGGGGGAGGVGNGNGTGGGGAGGLITTTTYNGTESAFTAVTATSYDVVVGSFGAGGTGSGLNIFLDTNRGLNGNNSKFDSIEAIGGGGGGAVGTNYASGANGGSGGGGASYSNPGGSGTTNQGNSGGTGSSNPGSVNRYRGGGGAGASQSGANGDTSGNGGDGISYTSGQNSITGSASSYAGGGGGGVYSTGVAAGTGGLGGGGNGASNTGNGASALTNTGSGGGGAAGAANYNGGNGGSGIVILRYATADVDSYATTGLTPTETTDGADTILSFTTVGTGTITFTTPIPPFSGTKVTTPVTNFDKTNTEEGLKIPSGTSSERPTGVDGMVRNDTNQSSNGSSSAITYYNGTNWRYFENKPEPIGSLIFEPASSIASGQINANKPLGQNFTFTRASTATFLGSNNLLQTAASGVPRIDYVGNTGGHILLEPSRTNIFQQSNNLSNNSWWAEVNSVSITSSDKNITSPTGAGNDAWTLTTDSGGGLKKVGVRMRNNGTNNHTISASTSKAMSIFVKKSSYDFIYFNSQKFQSDMNGDTWFNISNGTLGTASANHTSTKIEDYGNGWYRLSATVTAPASPADNVGQFSWHVANANGDTTVTADGTSTSFWYGGQIEVGEYGTSYIETVSADVTRAAETASGAGNSTLFNDSEGVLFADIAVLPETGRIVLNDGTTSNNSRLTYDSGTNTIYGILYNGSNQAVLSYVLPTEGSFNKIAFKYKTSDFSLYVNGFEVDSQTNSGTTFSAGTLSELDLDAGNGLIPFYGKVKQIKVFNTALTDAELASLTT